MLSGASPARKRISRHGRGSCQVVAVLNILWINAEQWAIDGLDRLGTRLRRAPQMAAHLLLGLRGEREALFELRRRGYTVVARRWTNSKLRGDLDLVAWDGEWLCFVEVKTRSKRNAMLPAEIAVDRDKQRMLRRMAQAYLRQFPKERREMVPVRFDVIAVYLDGLHRRFDLFCGAFGWQ